MTLDFNVLITALSRLEEILNGLVDAGVNHISDVSYQTTELKGIHAEARRRDVKAAREKAHICRDEASVELGKVLHLEDINPDVFVNWGFINPYEKVLLMMKTLMKHMIAVALSSKP